MRGKGSRRALAVAAVCAAAIGAGGILAPSAQAQAQARPHTPAQPRAAAADPGTLEESVSVTRADGRVAQFAIFALPGNTPNERLYYQTQTTPGGSYGVWSQVLDVPVNFQNPVLSAGVDADGRLEVFTVEYGTSTLVRIAQLTPDGAWSTPTAFGPGSASIPRFFGYPTVFQRSDNSLAVFEVYDTGTVPELFVNEQDSTGTWVSWTDLGAGPEPEAVGTPTQVTQAPDGTLTAVAHLWDASTGYYAKISELTPGGPWGAWQTCATDGCTNG
jgi:hypothetical protein